MFWVGLCLASGVVINGEPVDEAALKGLQLSGVDLMIDANGTIHITAPTFPPATSAATPVVPDPPIDSPSQPVPTQGWWLVAQDMDSSGHLVDVIINGMAVATFRSGKPAGPVHLAEHLKPGPNEVTLRANSQNASGGMFYVFVAEGEISNSEMRLETPAVQFGLGASRMGTYERTYTVNYTP